MKLTKDIAVIGAGGAGLAAAWALSKRHKVTLYEAGDKAGGHANTVMVEEAGRSHAIDCGFIVHNDRTYPNFLKLMAHLGVETQESDMSFAVSLDQGEREYAGTPLGLFSQTSLLASARHWRMVTDALRYFRTAYRVEDDTRTLGRWLADEGFSKAFIEDHLLPMAAAIWSCPPAEMLEFPVASFFAFCRNHGLLQLGGRPQWRTVTGASQRYVEALLKDFSGKVILGQPVEQIERTELGVLVKAKEVRRYDEVVLACHPDQALQLLGQGARAAEKELLSAIRYQDNRAVLHSDPALMPQRRRLWSSWNYLHWQGQPAVSYWMNRLQRLETKTPYFVTLNPPKAPKAEKTLAWFDYAHPVFDQAAIAAQNRFGEIQGQDRLWYCGAWCGYGFHEDAISSGLGVAASLSAPLPFQLSPGPALRTAQANRWELAAE